MCVDDFQVLKRIGQGSFGQVFRVRKRDTKRICASLNPRGSSTCEKLTVAPPPTRACRRHEGHLKGERTIAQCAGASAGRASSVGADQRLSVPRRSQILVSAESPRLLIPH